MDYESLARFQKQPIGEQAREIRLRLRISQRAMAKRMKVSQAAVCLIERRSPTDMGSRGGTVDKLAAALGVGTYLGGLVPPWLGGVAEDTGLEEI